MWTIEGIQRKIREYKADKSALQKRLVSEIMLINPDLEHEIWDSFEKKAIEWMI